MKRFKLTLVLSLFLFFSLFVLSFSFSYAASLYIEPSSGQYGRGDTFSVKVRVEPQEEECINAVDVYITYPQDIIKAVAISRGESILSLWVEEPRANNESGIIRLVGGIPGGYCGRIPGDPGLTNVIAELVFQVPGFSVGSSEESSVTLSIAPGSEVLLNDGFGTPTTIFASDARFDIVNERTGSNEWLERLQNDDRQPESFSLTLESNQSVFGGDYFIVFSALDKQTGIDFYEVIETDIDNPAVIRGTNEKGQWIKATSPHVLVDQSLNSVIRVRAFDKAGNQRIASLIPDENLRTFSISIIPKDSTRALLVPVVSTALIILILLGVYVYIRKRRKVKHDRITPTDYTKKLDE